MDRGLERIRETIREVRGESPAIHGGDESDNRATPAGIKPVDSVSVVKHNEQKLAVGLGSARTTKATTPFPQGRLRGRGDTAGKKRPSLGCACPPYHEGQAGRWHGPCPDAGKPATGGIPAVSVRRTGCTVQADTASEWMPNTPHPSRGRRIAHEPGIASPDPIRQARRCQRGRGTGPLSRAGILALQRGEDVKQQNAVERHRVSKPNSCCLQTEGDSECVFSVIYSRDTGYGSLSPSRNRPETPFRERPAMNTSMKLGQSLREMYLRVLKPHRGMYTSGRFSEENPSNRWCSAPIWGVRRERSRRWCARVVWP